MGYDVNLIWPSDYGVHFYSDTLFTTDSIIAEKPDVVTGFTRAVLNGYRDAVGDTGLAVQAKLKYAKDSDRDTQTKMMQASVPLIHTGEYYIGWMNAGVWDSMNKMLTNQGLLINPVVTGSVYTMEFLEKIYRGKAQ